MTHTPGHLRSQPKFRGKRVLVATHSLKGFTGSEVHSMQVGSYFSSQGAEVVFMAFETGEPMVGELARLGLRVVGPWDLVRLKALPFDIVWSHHETTFLWLHVVLGICARRNVHGLLSSRQKIERLPLISTSPKGAHLCLVANSVETRDHVISQSGRCDIEIMPNIVPRAFFEHPRMDLPARPQRVAIVSNHVPEELHEMRSALAAEGVAVTIFGVGHNYTRIDHTTLTPFDVVVTIGKTVQYGIAQGIPVFVYDRFGGPGYLGANGIEFHARYNFSGRSDPRRRGGKILASELFAGFSVAAKETEPLRRIYAPRFAIDTCVAEAVRSLCPAPAPLLNKSERWSTILRHLKQRPQPLVRILISRPFAKATAVWDLIRRSWK